MHQQPPVSEHEIGVVMHYWGHIGVAGVRLTEDVDVGDHIHILGHTTDLEQDIGSMQIEHGRVYHANPGDEIGIRVNGHVREHDHVFKLECDDVGIDEHDL